MKPPSTPTTLVIIMVAWLVSSLDVTVYQVGTAITGIRELFTLSRSDIDGCTAAYEFFQSRQDGTATQGGSTDEETEHVRAYYTVLNYVLAVADVGQGHDYPADSLSSPSHCLSPSHLPERRGSARDSPLTAFVVFPQIEKMYIPPQIDPKQGLFQNQFLLEQGVFDTLQLPAPATGSKLLDIGCGRGRIAHHAATVTGASIAGFNIDQAQITNAIEYASETGLSHRLDFKVGDHHKRFQYEDGSFDGAYSFQALWPFFKEHEVKTDFKSVYCEFPLKRPLFQ